MCSSFILYAVISDGWFVLGAPWDCSGTGRGEHLAPDALRSAGLARLVRRDLGDVPTVIASTTRDPHTGVLALRDTVRAARVLTAALTSAMRDVPDRRPLVVGGDCSILLGIFPALRSLIGRVGMWFADGHPDYLDGSSSDTGETADMELAILTGVGAPSLVTLAGDAPMLAASDVVLIGHRTQDLDDGAAADLARVPSDLPQFDAVSLRENAAATGRRAADLLEGTGQSVWLHLDLDVLDALSLPAVTYPQPGGPDWDQLYAALRPMALSPRLLGVSIADFRPDLDPTGTHAARVVQFLEHTLP